MTQPREVVVTAGDAGGRLDTVVARRTGISRAQAARLIASGLVEVDGAPGHKSLRVEVGMRLRLAQPEPKPGPEPERIDVRVVYDDAWVLVVSKPAGLVVHPAPGHPSGTLVNALLASPHRPAGGDAQRPGIVHRLDVGTSGLMIVAKDEEAHARLTEALGARAVGRAYLALVEGGPDSHTGTIDAPIGRSPRHRKKMAVVAGGKDALTRFAVLERHARTALLEVRPETGRTHQIRVHLAAAGHPVVGDPVYGRDRRLAQTLGLARPFLHAARLSFAHPITGQQIDLEDPLPPDLEAALARARTA